MIFYNAEKALKFSWCVDWSFPEMQSLRDKGSVETFRVCYITTQVYRIYLAYIEGRWEYWPYQYRDNAWRLVYKHLCKVRPVELEVLESEESLRRALEFQIVLQFRDSIEGYFNELSTAEQILATLGGEPTTHTLDELRYTYYPVDVQDDPEWDGAVEVHCDGGGLLLPYQEGTDGTRSLVVKYATFAPDSVCQHVVRKVLDKLDNVVATVQNVHWSNLRLLVEKRGR